MISFTKVQEIVQDIHEARPAANSVYYVGCGASQGELYPGKYFLECNAKTLRASMMQANEFVHATPAAVGENAIVIACSLGGTTPETVAAAKKATELGAKVIAITHDGESPLVKASEYVIVHGFEADYAAKVEKMSYAILLACEILNAYEGCALYEDMKKGLTALFPAINDAARHALPGARAFAQQYQNAPVIYVMSSGATLNVAYTFSVCLMMEMQWINSGNFHDGDFFHGPFEIVDKDVPFLLFMNEGRTRALDSRALDFLNRFDALTTVVDAKDYGLSGTVGSAVAEYLNPVLITAVVRVYAEQLAELRNHPLTMRRYMWKLEY